MRRGVGIAGLQRQVQAKGQFQEVGSALASTQLEQLKEQMAMFKSNLEDFAQKYRKDIRGDPLFRQHFQKMCNNIGVDPLASNKGFWAELLGVGDFYYELGVQTVEICISRRERNGGLMDLDEVRKQLRILRGKNAQDVSEDDILRAIKGLKTLGGGFEVILVGSKKLVQSVPRELNTDHAAVLSQAQDTGYVSESIMASQLGWTMERIQHVLEHLVHDGILWIDTQDKETLYWVPSFFSE